MRWPWMRRATHEREVDHCHDMSRRLQADHDKDRERLMDTWRRVAYRLGDALGIPRSQAPVFPIYSMSQPYPITYLRGAEPLPDLELIAETAARWIETARLLGTPPRGDLLRTQEQAPPSA